MVALPNTFVTEPHYKEQFASFLCRGYTPFVAALQIWPKDAGFAHKISELWAQDEYVLACKDKFQAEVEAKNKPPTKAAQIKRIEDRIQTMDDETALKAERLIAEMLGHIEKAAPATVNVQNNTFDRVLIVKDHGTNDQWEEKARDQQQKLKLLGSKSV